MKTYINPPKNEWESLTARPLIKQENLQDLVLEIFNDIRENRDVAVRKYSEKFDKSLLVDLKVSQTTIDRESEKISEELKKAIQQAKGNIERFHESQKEEKKIVETTAGVQCWRESRPIEKVGIYIPGGTAPLFSTVLMLAIPAKIAGCKEIILCTPPNQEGNINPAILYTAQLVGITQVFAVGGIQAIGALTFGTESIPKVDKIFGPGNQFVTAAKQMTQNFGVSIDMPAGPSEVLVIADESANPDFVAADLLSQAEHGVDSQVIFLTTDEEILNQTLAEIDNQLSVLPRQEIASKAIENSKSILLENMEDCIAFSNLYAPEHLILAINNYQKYLPEISNAGSVFLGNYSCESAGDYASGTNHTLPTNGYARNYSGVSLDSFVKKITFQELSAEGIQNIGKSIELMAEAEQLMAHKNAVTLRLQSL